MMRVIKLSELKAGMIFDKEVYFLPGEVFLKANTPLSEEALNFARLLGIKEFQTSGKVVEIRKNTSVSNKPKLLYLKKSNPDIKKLYKCGYYFENGYTHMAPFIETPSLPLLIRNLEHSLISGGSYIINLFGFNIEEYLSVKILKNKIKQLEINLFKDVVGIKPEGESYSVMIVDDSEPVRKSLIKILKENGFNIIAVCKDGQEALGVFEKLKEKIDIVFLDIAMPHLDGIATLIGLKQIKKGVKVIMISILGRESVVKDAISHGADGYILKPIDGERFKKNFLRIIK